MIALGHGLECFGVDLDSGHVDIRAGGGQEAVPNLRRGGDDADKDTFCAKVLANSGCSSNSCKEIRWSAAYWPE